MAAVKGSHTAPEVRVRKFLHAAGLRFSTHAGRLPGRPDIVLTKRRVIVFVHGCFWHQHQDCGKAIIPLVRRTYWQAKLLNNVKRDKRVKRQLRSMGWHVFTIWECRSRDAGALTALLGRIKRASTGK